MGTSAVVQRVHDVRAEVQEATIARVVRNRRPIKTEAADAAERTNIGVAKARSREIDSSSLTAIGPEVMTKIICPLLPVVCTVNIHL